MAEVMIAGTRGPLPAYLVTPASAAPGDARLRPEHAGNEVWVPLADPAGSGRWLAGRLAHLRGNPVIVPGASVSVAGLLARQLAGVVLRCENRLALVRDSGCLPEERGSLAAVCGLARDWFTGHLECSADLVT
jgi:hypothetical protein